MIGCLIAAVTGLWLIVTSTSPATIHPLGILGVFFFIYVISTVLITFILLIAGDVISRITQLAKGVKADIKRIAPKRAYMFASVLALMPVIVFAMQSVGANDFSGVALILLFEVLACFYVWRRS